MGMVRVGAAAFVGLVGVALPLATPAAGQAGPAVKVSMKNFAFAPAKVTINAGDTVTWTYDEQPTDLGCENPVFQLPGAPVSCPGHSATAVDKGTDGKLLFDSGVHRADGFPYSFTFTKPGTYHYICVVHGGPNKNNPVTNMEGDVVVEAAASAASPAAPATTTAAASVQGASSAAPAAAVGQLSNTGGRSLLGWSLLPLGAALFLSTRRRG